ncbi:hypothetical protein OIU84_017359 [Salix udensis]|uniref:Uncharacterized protein n=1 Tax=Salix udensis TaxID=889485 RepID=A0AAD6PLP9_9ROSI|nr:hypothetical protein OIU84_017359 [Salix udensis]
MIVIVDLEPSSPPATA